MLYKTIHLGVGQIKEPKSNEMGQGSPKQHEYKPNDSTKLQEFGKRKAYSKPKRGPVETSQIITCRQSTETIELKRGKVFNKLALG